MKIIPDKIYLQIHDEQGEEIEERTWCEDKINRTDVEYIRFGRKEIRKAFEDIFGPLHDS